METMIKETTKVFVDKSDKSVDIKVNINGITVSLFGIFKIERSPFYEGYCITVNPSQFVHIRDNEKTPVFINYWDDTKKEYIKVLEHKGENNV